MVGLLRSMLVSNLQTVSERWLSFSNLARARGFVHSAGFKLKAPCQHDTCTHPIVIEAFLTVPMGTRLL